MDREALQALLETFCPNVYFQPPDESKMQYPAILYIRDDRATEFADNAPYSHMVRYMVTIMDYDPDSEIPNQVADLPLCRFNRHYRADGLNHDVYNLYFGRK